MQIGAFARLCDTKLSVLRHYDKEGILMPAYVDPITGYGDRIISGESMQTWTRGYVLRKWNSTACAYEIRVIDDTPYLFIEWKSGDYIWGGREPHQYVFVRDTNP